MENGCRPWNVAIWVKINLAIFFMVISLVLPNLACNTQRPVALNTDISEPDAVTSSYWWPQQQNVWTPIGWKNHLFRFNVLYNGTIISQPDPVGRKATSSWSEQDLMLTFQLEPDGEPLEIFDTRPYQLRAAPDRGYGIQQWKDELAPVLVSEWRLDNGLVIQSEIFAHLPGTGEVQRGDEPLFAWTRLSLKSVDRLSAPDSFSFVIRIGSVNIQRNMMAQRNLTAYPARAAYKRRLTAEWQGGTEQRCLHFLETDGRARLAVSPAFPDGVSLEERPAVFQSRSGEKNAYDYYLTIKFPVRQGVLADLLIPAVPVERNIFENELTLGYDSILADCNRYWATLPETAAHIETPEYQFNEAISRNLQFAEVIAEKNPQTEEYSLLSGSWTYAMLWPTPTSMTSHMLLDPLGYHKSVERYLEIFRQNQGTVQPPGPSYSPHPGYFSSPKTLTSIDWLADHGAILYEVSKHALLTGDREFIERWTNPIVLACEFIRDSRSKTAHDGIKGILPPAVATDRMVPTQSVWNIGWNYKGLSEAVRLLRTIDHPRADEFEAEAREYRETFVRQYRAAEAEMPTWTGCDGVERHLAPMTLSSGGDLNHGFYLDTGPMFLVWSGLLPADEPIMKNSVEFFRNGPNRVLYDSRTGNCWQRPVLFHEISSCEPCYSWNIFHSWQLNDRGRFLEGMYSLLAGALSRQTYISCETRHGIYGNVFATPLLVDLMRLSVIDDEISEGELHLLRLVPLAWIRDDFETKFEKIPSVYGPVSLSFKLSTDGKELQIKLKSEFRNDPRKIILHTPPVTGLESIAVNGKIYSVKSRPSLELVL